MTRQSLVTKVVFPHDQYVSALRLIQGFPDKSEGTHQNASYWSK